MSDATLRIRANRLSGDLEIEGSPEMVKEWWEKLWPTFEMQSQEASILAKPIRNSLEDRAVVPDLFGEFLHQHRSDITDIDRLLIAAAFIQTKDTERIFTTKMANQTLLDQNIKVANASVSVRRLVEAKRAFVVSDGKFRVSSSGFEHLNLLKTPHQNLNAIEK